MTLRVRASGRPTFTSVALVTALCSTLAATGCSVLGGDGDDSARADRVVVVSHESFSLDDALLEKFEESTGYSVDVRPIGDAGSLSTELALNADNPRGDVAFGVDNTFASRVLDSGALAEHRATLPKGAERYVLAEGADRLAPVDVADVCLNVDTGWFAERDLAAPATLDDLLEPRYRDLTVLPGATTSSPGMAFLLTTVAAKGDGWKKYWSDLLANGAKVVDGWSDAYYTDFTAASEAGKRPIVLSYDSSPAFTVDDEGRSSTAALLDTCFQQVEYAGVLEGADNEEGARAFVEFLLSTEVQNSLPEQMYVYPVSAEATLPEDWTKHAKQPEKSWALPPAEISANRETWLKEWNDILTR